MTHRRTWQRREEKAAAAFGVKRQIGSGSGGREDETRSDSTHDRLFIETKLRTSWAARTLWEDTRKKAMKEGKTPVVVLCTKGKRGGLVVCHQDDLAAVARELVEADGTVVCDAREG